MSVLIDVHCNKQGPISFRLIRLNGQRQLADITKPALKSRDCHFSNGRGTCGDARGTKSSSEGNKLPPARLVTES